MNNQLVRSWVERYIDQLLGISMEEYATSSVIVRNEACSCKSDTGHAMTQHFHPALCRARDAAPLRVERRGVNGRLGSGSSEGVDKNAGLHG